MNLKNYKIFLKYKLFEIWGIWILSNCVLNEIFWNIVLEFFIGGLGFFFLFCLDLCYYYYFEL